MTYMPPAAQGWTDDVPLSFQLADRLRREMSNQGVLPFDSSESLAVGGMFVYLWPVIQSAVKEGD